TDINRRLALSATWGVEDALSDVGRSKYILNFGSDPYGGCPVDLVQRIVDARSQGGARLVTFDVRTTKTAGKSDEWLPVNPGTDGLVALSMASVIVEERLADIAFLDRWSNVTSGYLAGYLASYMPEATESRTGVAAADVRRIAREFALNRPATVLMGGGISNRQNGVQNERCIFLLNAVTGNIDVPGGYCLPVAYPLREPDPVPQKPDAGKIFGGGVVSPYAVLSLIGDGTLQAGVYMSYMSNPAYSNADTTSAINVLKDERLIPYSIAVDVLPSETASYADMVLPDATFLERWDIESPLAYEGVPFVLLRQPVVSSPGEAAPFHEVCIELGRRIGNGVERFSSFRGAQDYLKAMADGIPGLKAAGGLDYLKDHGVWYDEKAVPAYRTYESGGFATASKRLEIRSTDLESKGFGALPAYSPIDAYSGVGKDDLYMVTYEYGLLSSHLAGCKWLSEIEHSSVVLINADTAQDRGIHEGDVVEVRSATGSIKVRARLTQGIHPRVVAAPTGACHWGLGRIAQAVRFKSDDPDTKLIWWKEGDNFGAHPKALVA
ncbi:MAG: molybdopterin-dependent oxidoreductase, partial [Dehalococcoidia bacterium]|nr:molybdopterin-dependent oxidoreductase [Dehalococcoidia bacterium]